MRHARFNRYARDEIAFRESGRNRRNAFKIGLGSGKQLIEAITRIPPDKAEALGALRLAVLDTKARLTKELEIATVCEHRFLAALSLRGDIQQVFEAAQRIAAKEVDIPPLH